MAKEIKFDAVWVRFGKNEESRAFLYTAPYYCNLNEGDTVICERGDDGAEYEGTVIAIDYITYLPNRTWDMYKAIAGCENPKRIKEKKVITDFIYKEDEEE